MVIKNTHKHKKCYKFSPLNMCMGSFLFFFFNAWIILAKGLFHLQISCDVEYNTDKWKFNSRDHWLKTGLYTMSQFLRPLAGFLQNTAQAIVYIYIELVSRIRKWKEFLFVNSFILFYFSSFFLQACQIGKWSYNIWLTILITGNGIYLWITKTENWNV